MLDKLYKIMHLGRTERVAKIKGIMLQCEKDDIMLLSFLLLPNDSKIRQYKEDREIINPYHYEIVLFMYFAQTNLSTGLRFLSKKRKKVVIALLQGTYFPKEYILEHVKLLYGENTILSYISDMAEEVVWYSLGTTEKVGYVYRAVSNISTNMDVYKVPSTPRTCSIDTNSTIIGDINLYNYMRGMSISDNPTALLSFIELRTKKPKWAMGKYIYSFRISGYSSEYVPYLATKVKPYDWLLNDEYEIIGVKYKFNNKTYEVKYNIPRNTNLDAIEINIQHNTRGTVKGVRLDLP